MAEEKQLIPADTVLPGTLCLLPLQGNPIFPGVFMPLMIQDPPEMALIEKALSGDSVLGMLLLKSGEGGANDENDFYRVGTAAKIVKKINLPDGGMNIFISTLKRFRIKRFLTRTFPFNALVEYVEDSNDKNIETRAYMRAVITEMKQLSQENPLFSEDMRLNLVNIDQPGKVADFAASILNISRDEQQRVLELADVQQRFIKVLFHIKKEQELLRIQKKVQQDINEKVEKSQKEYFLKEELKIIQKELGLPTDAKTGELRRFAEAVKNFNLSGEVKEQVEQELEKFSLMDPNSSEFIVTRNYLETIINLPWNDPLQEEFDILKAREILDADHYGLNDVKDRILEFLAVRKLKKDSRGSILCLVGAPGVGKTSIGKSIAQAMNKQFFRFSVGGMRDEAEIKGHRRTYVGAMPGKIIQGLRIVKTKDPVFMIDEIDKMGVSYQGDPSSALLEVLDPEQNVSFRDHYLDLPFDISRILFIATANTLDSIPQPLIDRMEIIRLSGYIDEEKIAIARRYLIPKSLLRAGVKKKDVKYSPAGLKAIARNYARESGMRSFEKALDKIHRKLAKAMVLEEKKPPFLIDSGDLESFLGKEVFRSGDIKEAATPGTAIGLAWTSLGGDTLIIEAVDNPGTDEIKLTGQMGKVMQESAAIAYSWVRHWAAEWGVQEEWFKDKSIHLHIPEGATPKDGPSAGITMASALLSLAARRTIKPFLAMTGELSLTGKILPIGGLKEKTIAAQRNRIKTILIPQDNLKDLDEIPDHIRRGIKFIPLSTMNQAVPEIFGRPLPGKGASPGKAGPA
ncbi:MAG: endopeptidase La [Spirochaetales bacterium]|jgi:ATP-dependent Lon protease|nr:endopeptidase La [Spirochaetales bacterium]